MFGKRKIEPIEVHITMQISANVLILVSNPSNLVIDASGVPATATVGVPYTGAFAASGGVAPYTWTDTSSSESVVAPAVSGFPTGLTLNSDGTVTGTPAASIADQTTFKAQATVTDSTGASVLAKVKSFVNKASTAVKPVASVTKESPSILK